MRSIHEQANACTCVLPLCIRAVRVLIATALMNGKSRVEGKPLSDDRRLIEDFLPIQAISAEASREKSVRKGHISTLHLWWAMRKKPSNAKREIVAARFYEIPAEAVEQASRE